MIETLKDKSGLVYAYIEWLVVNDKGIMEEDGEYVNVRDLWIHKDYRGGKIIQIFISKLDIDQRTKNVKWIYWKRSKFNERTAGLFPRDKAARKGVKLWSV